MLQKRLSRWAPLFLLLLFSAPTISKAGQLLGVSQDNPDWSDWKSAPNFPGIKIRVLCGTYVQSTGNAQWSFQFQNTYSKKVYLVYQEETGESTGAPPTFSTPGGRNLGPGEKSDVYTDYLRGSCESRKQIFIRIVSVSDDQGNQTQARKGASRSGAFIPAPQSSTAASVRGNHNSPSDLKTSPGTGNDGSNTQSDISCDPNWSPQWNKLRSEYQQKLRGPGVVDQAIQGSGGLQTLLAAEKAETEGSDLDALQRTQSSGMIPPGWTPEQYLAFRRGLFDIAHCRAGISRSDVPAQRQTSAGISSSEIVGSWRCWYSEDNVVGHYFRLLPDGSAFGFLGKTT